MESDQSSQNDGRKVAAVFAEQVRRASLKVEREKDVRGGKNPYEVGAWAEA